MLIEEKSNGSYVLRFSDGSSFIGDSRSLPLKEIHVISSIIRGDSDYKAAMVYGAEASGKKLLVKKQVNEYAGSGSLYLSAEKICKSLLEMLLRHMKDASGEGMIASQQAYVDWLSDKDVLLIEGLGDIQSKYRLERYVTMVLGLACQRGTRILCIGPTYLDDALERLSMSIYPGRVAIMEAQIMQANTAFLFAREKAEHLALALTDKQLSQLVEGLFAYPPLIQAALMYIKVTERAGLSLNINEILTIFSKSEIKNCVV